MIVMNLNEQIAKFIKWKPECLNPNVRCSGKKDKIFCKECLETMEPPDFIGDDVQAFKVLKYLGSTYVRLSIQIQDGVINLELSTDYWNEKGESIDTKNPIANALYNLIAIDSGKFPTTTNFIKPSILEAY
jgi:hypothetical protein